MEGGREKHNRKDTNEGHAVEEVIEVIYDVLE